MTKFWRAHLNQLFGCSGCWHGDLELPGSVCAEIPFDLLCHIPNHVYLSMYTCPSTYLSIHLSIYSYLASWWCMYLSFKFPLCLFIHPSIHPSIHPCIYSCIYLSIYLSNSRVVHPLMNITAESDVWPYYDLIGISIYQSICHLCVHSYIYPCNCLAAWVCMNLPIHSSSCPPSCLPIGVSVVYVWIKQCMNQSINVSTYLCIDMGICIN